PEPATAGAHPAPAVMPPLPAWPIPGANTAPGAMPPPSNWSGDSRRPAPPPLPRPTLARGAPPPQAPQPVEEIDELPNSNPSNPTGPIIGIDLGTTNSCAAVVKDGKPFRSEERRVGKECRGGWGRGGRRKNGD